MTSSESEDSPDGGARDLGSRVAKGGVVLVVRQAISFALSFGSGVVLARVLDPADFGAYAVVLFVVAISNVLSDAGLSASLIRSRVAPTRHQYSMVFTAQLIVATVFAACIVVTSPWVSGLYGNIGGLSSTLMLAAGAVMVGPVISIGTAKLSRSLRFGAVGMLQLLQGAILSIVVSLAAIAGVGVQSFGYSILISSICMAIGVTVAAGPPPVPTLRLRPLIGWLRFALPYSASGIVSVLKDAVNPVYIGLTVGVAASGYVKWAQQTSVLGVYLITAVAPLLYAAFARLQDKRNMLTRAVDTGLFWANAITAPVALVLVIYIRELTVLVYGERWTEAIPLFLWLSVSCLITPTTTVAMALLNSAGKSGTTLVFTLLWLAGSWLLVPLLVPTFGFIAYGIANATVQIFGIAMIHIASRLVDVRWYRTLSLPWVLAGISAIPAVLVRLVGGSSVDLVWVIVGSLSLVVAYLLALRFVTYRRWHEILGLIRRSK